MAELHRERAPRGTGDPGLDGLERANYRLALSDGILDLGVGLMFLGMAAVWLLAENLAGLAAIVPAAFIVPMLEIRRRMTEARGGYVQFTAARRASERATLRGMLLLGIGFLAAAVVTYFLVRRGGSSAGLTSVSAGLPGLLIALPLALGAALSGLIRVKVYALVALATSAIVVALEANPGWSLLATGVAMLGTGVPLLVRYLRKNPLPNRDAA